MDSLGYQVDHGLDFQSFSYECPSSRRSTDQGYWVPVESPESVDPPAPTPLTKQLRTEACVVSSSSPQLISFQHSNNASSRQFHDSSVKLEAETLNIGCNENLLDFASFGSQFGECEKQRMHKGGSMTRNSVQAQDHVMAERKRRDKLNQGFVALSAIIPGLKKVN